MSWRSGLLTSTSVETSIFHGLPQNSGRTFYGFLPESAAFFFTSAGAGWGISYGCYLQGNDFPMKLLQRLASAHLYSFTLLMSKVNPIQKMIACTYKFQLVKPSSHFPTPNLFRENLDTLDLCKPRSEF